MISFGIDQRSRLSHRSSRYSPSHCATLRRTAPPTLRDTEESTPTESREYAHKELEVKYKKMCVDMCMCKKPKTSFCQMVSNESH